MSFLSTRAALVLSAVGCDWRAGSAWMLNPSTRRAALGAILAAPLASVPAVAAVPHDLPEHQVRFLALAPTLLPVLTEYDRLWAEATRLYGIAEAAHPRPEPRIFSFDALTEADRNIVITPVWRVYLTTRRPADDLDNRLEAIVSPFMDEPMLSLPAILLKHRIGITLGHYEDDAMGDIGRLTKEVLCA
ncbi:hypothetical protein [Methylobacterium sp. NEAU K]|uniref:hypothetical protein n=1 Tax=Methylobacterium sp. NEAU K TaxID=3064946 RepID=UPI002734E708|nr:hypothetical protein [Methylobacterium sp. NEAU K]MDP4006924.1 hypothetical protein [Methylobacterium sp. NEAU K]